jgi:hypothetical protein
VRDLATVNAQRLVIEQDDSLIAADQADLWSAVTRQERQAHSPTSTSRLVPSRSCGLSTQWFGAGPATDDGVIALGAVVTETVEV